MADFIALDRGPVIGFVLPDSIGRWTIQTMSKSGERLIEAARQARAVAKWCTWPRCGCERKCRAALKMGEVVPFAKTKQKEAPSE